MPGGSGVFVALSSPYPARLAFWDRACAGLRATAEKTGNWHAAWARQLDLTFDKGRSGRAEDQDPERRRRASEWAALSPIARAINLISDAIRSKIL